MPRKADGLFPEYATFQALIEATLRAARGKRRKPGAAAFLARLESEVLRLEKELGSGTWRPGRYVVIDVFDPKHRRVSAAPFRDRVVHHALCKVIEPIFERGFIDDSYANRKGKGVHRAIARYEAYRDRFSHVLRCDIFRYFPAIDHQILKGDLRRRIVCPQTLMVLDAIIDGSNLQEPVEIHFPGDDLFTPLERRRGLPIGNLTSQFFANVYLDGFDHFVKEVLRAPYLRYVDDFALFADDPLTLEIWRARIAEYLCGRRLLLHPEKTRIHDSRMPTEFLGMVLLPGGRRRLPEDGVRRFRNRLRGFARRFLEQQSKERSRRQPQQEHHSKPEQQQRLPCCQYTFRPEPRRSRPPRARGRVSRGCHDEAVRRCRRTFGQRRSWSLGTTGATPDSMAESSVNPPIKVPFRIVGSPPAGTGPYGASVAALTAEGCICAVRHTACERPRHGDLHRCSPNYA